MSMTFWNCLILLQNFKEIEMMKIFLLVLVAVAIIILAPFATLWALNTLFPVLVIPYTFETWLAAIVLGGLFSQPFYGKHK